MYSMFSQVPFYTGKLGKYINQGDQKSVTRSKMGEDHLGLNIGCLIGKFQQKEKEMPKPIFPHGPADSRPDTGCVTPSSRPDTPVVWSLLPLLHLGPLKMFLFL